MASKAGVATSQRGWGEALASLLIARGVTAVALDPSGGPWRDTEADDGTATDDVAGSRRWPVMLVDAADAAAPQIVDSVPADVRVGLGEHRPPLLPDIDVWVAYSEPRRLAAVVREPRDHHHRRASSPNRRLDEPTARERAVLELLREGLSNAEIARCLGMSPNTVRTHVQNLLTKLGARSRFEAAVIANGEHPHSGREVLR